MLPATHMLYKTVHIPYSISTGIFSSKAFVYSLRKGLHGGTKTSSLPPPPPSRGEGYQPLPLKRNCMKKGKIIGKHVTENEGGGNIQGNLRSKG